MLKTEGSREGKLLECVKTKLGLLPVGVASARARGEGSGSQFQVRVIVKRGGGV